MEGTNRKKKEIVNILSDKCFFRPRFSRKFNSADSSSFDDGGGGGGGGGGGRVTPDFVHNHPTKKASFFDQVVPIY